MDRTEHLLTVLAEECAEVGQAVAKALRFGLDDHKSLDPAVLGTDGPTNRERIAEELGDVMAIADWLHELGLLPKLYTFTKRTKVEAYMEYAQRTGALQANGGYTHAG